MIVYFGETVTVTAKGRGWRKQLCEHCRKQFYYMVGFAVTRAAHNPYLLDPDSQYRAANQAEDGLYHVLRRGVFPAPCPHCSLYQTEMLPAVRAVQFPGMLRAAKVFLGLIPVAFLLGIFILGVWARSIGLAMLIVLPLFCLSASIGFFVARHRRQAAFDPNAEEYAESRQEASIGCSLKPEEFAKLEVMPLTTPPRAQLVGLNCACCGVRIYWELDGQFCQACGSPVHTQCVRPGTGNECLTCGVAAADK